MTAIRLTANATCTITITCTPPASDPEWTLENATDIAFMAKVSASDADSEAIIAESKDEGGITVVGDYTLKVVIADTAWPEDVPDKLVWGLMALDGTGRVPLATGSALVSRAIPAVAPVP